MAAAAPAPVKTVAQRPEPDTYIFRLTTKFPELFTGSSPYAVRLALPSSDVILWPYRQTDDGLKPFAFGENIGSKQVVYQSRSIRYLSGVSSIFVDEQEAGGHDTYKRDGNGLNPVLDNPANKDDLTFQKGEIRVASFNKSLRNYLWCRNDCKNQYEKANDKGKRMKPLLMQYELINNVESGEIKIKLGELRNKAYQVAKDARYDEMKPHAKFLNIQFNYSGTDELKDDEVIKEEYIDYALANPELFLKTFTDPRVKVTYQIRNLVEDGDITFHKTPGQAHWVSTGAFITQLPPDKEPVAFLSEFALTKDGEEFSNNLRALK